MPKTKGTKSTKSIKKKAPSASTKKAASAKKAPAKRDVKKVTSPVKDSNPRSRTKMPHSSKEDEFYSQSSRGLRRKVGTLSDNDSEVSSGHDYSNDSSSSEEEVEVEEYFSAHEEEEEEEKLVSNKTPSTTKNHIQKTPSTATSVVLLKTPIHKGPEVPTSGKFFESPDASWGATGDVKSPNLRVIPPNIHKCKHTTFFRKCFFLFIYMHTSIFFYA